MTDRYVPITYIHDNIITALARRLADATPAVRRRERQTNGVVHGLVKTFNGGRDGADDTNTRLVGLRITTTRYTDSIRLFIIEWNRPDVLISVYQMTRNENKNISRTKINDLKHERTYAPTPLTQTTSNHETVTAIRFCVSTIDNKIHLLSMVRRCCDVSTAVTAVTIMDGERSRRSPVNSDPSRPKRRKVYMDVNSDWIERVRSPSSF